MTDWLMVIITAVYVLATIIICIINSQANKLTRKQIEESNRPIITIYFEIIRSELMCFVIENIGKSSARNVAVQINNSFVENLPDAEMKTGLLKLSSPRLYLGSGQKLFVPLGPQLHFDKVSSELALIKVTYNDIYETDIEIDISQYGWTLLYKSAADDSAQYLKKISNSINQKKTIANYTVAPIVASGKGVIIPIIERLINTQGKPQAFLSVLNDTNEILFNLTFKFKHPKLQNEIWKGLQMYPIGSIVPGQKIGIGWISPTMAEPTTAICEISWTDSEGHLKNQSTTV
jgi:hypothetical protein